MQSKSSGSYKPIPIRAPARAQDLTLRHRVVGYRAGDLERCYARLPVEEDFFVNYGFLPRAHHALMHPRTPAPPSAAQARRSAAVLAFVRERGVVHPREVDAHFAHGKVTNWFGGSSNASTQLLDAMHYRGLLRVARREGGTRVYVARDAAHDAAAAPDAPSCATRMDALVDVIVGKYAPLPAALWECWSPVAPWRAAVGGRSRGCAIPRQKTPRHRPRRRHRVVLAGW